jgi:NAD(P)-dependent dehydrogenase (short-subunit alcohol dehydrogenase family)
MTIALITGGSRGLGRSSALHLARAGVDVVITWLGQEAAAREVVTEIEALGRRAAALQLDTRDIASFAGFAETLETTLVAWGPGGLDLLVNNAGTGLYVPFAETTEAQFDDMLNVHLKGVFFLTQRLLPLLRDGGRILNVSSGLARVSLPGSSAYGTMKGAVEVLTRYLARELGPRGISVNVVAPGPVETDFGGGRIRSNPDLKNALSAQAAMGRTGVAEDIGPLVASLLTSGSNWVTGQRIEASGGFQL